MTGARRKRPTAIRRSQPSYSPDDLLNATLSAPLLWPGRTIRLRRDSLLDYAGRSTSAQVSVAELYHENSKLSREHLAELVYTAVDAPALRTEFLRRRTARAPRDSSARGAPWSAIVESIFASSPELFYAVEVRLVIDGTVLAYEPGSGMVLLAQLTLERQQDLLNAIRLLDPKPAVAGREALAVAVLLGSFSRNDVLLSIRGYRRTLLEAGRLSQEIMNAASRSGRSARVRFEFADRELDLIMEADGVEEGVLVVVELE